MERDKLVKVFIIENILYIPVFALFSIVLIIAEPSTYVITTCVSMMIGLCIGVTFNHFVQIPKLYGEKDERQLIIQIVAVALSLGIAFLLSFFLFFLTGMEIIDIGRIQTLFIALSITLIAFIIRFVSYKVLDYVL